MNRHKLDLLDFKPSALGHPPKDVGGVEELQASAAILN